MPAGSSTSKRSRRYESPIRAQRAQETRAALMTAATRLFTTNGWKGTGMRDVAEEAGVATETLYSHFSSKRVLLQAVMDVAVVGDEQALAVAERPEFAALGHGRRRDRIAAAASLLAAVHERTAAFAKVLREAAPGDEQIADLLQSTRQRQRRDVESGVALIMGRTATKTEADEIWALMSPELYLLLVEETGWSVEQYEAWVAATLDRVVPRS